MKFNLKWPHKPGNDLAPWYVVTWRTLFFPIVYSGFIVSFIGMFLCLGPESALSWWEYKEYFD